jgi:hypothetical protein
MNLSKIGEIKFNDVYYVPKLTMNLISIGSFVVELQSRRLACISISWMTHNFLFVLWSFII